MMLMSPHGFDVALCGFIVKNAALSLSLVGHLCSSITIATLEYIGLASSNIWFGMLGCKTK